MDQQQQQVNEAAEKFAAAVTESYLAVLAEAMRPAQELSTTLAKNFFNQVFEDLLSQRDSNREITQQLTDQQQRAAQVLWQESARVYMDFINSMFPYWQNIEQAQRQMQQAQNSAASAERSKEAIELLDEWLADDSGYDEETWQELKASLNRDRLSNRKLFVD